MPAYLFLWNPSKDAGSFANYERVCADAAAGRPYLTRWICPSRQPQPGDLALVQRTGNLFNGIFARGVVTRSPYRDGGKQVVQLVLNAFLPEGRELHREGIVARSSFDKPWMPMASGNVIPPSILVAILELWDQAESGQSQSAGTTETVFAEELQGLEGDAKARMALHRSREAVLREAKIEEVLRRTGRLACEVAGCGFDFGRAYGQLGSGYAHVHHLQPLASRNGAETTRLSDLAVVCANCHAMIHRNGECRDLSALRAQSLHSN